MRLSSALALGLAAEAGQRIAWAEAEAWPLAAKVLGCVAVAAATAAIGYALVVADARAALAAAQAQTTQLAAEVERKQALANQGAATAEQHDSAKFEVRLAGLSSEAEVPALLEGIGQAAAAEALAIVQLEVGTERPAWLGTSASSVDGAPGPDDATPVRYLELPIEIEVRGGYHQLGAFAAAAAALPHLVALGDFELRVVDDDPGQLALTLAASTYRRANPTGAP